MQLEYYLLWSSFSLVIFYLFYVLLLRKETFFVFNRIYLLASLCIAMLIPFADLSWFNLLPKPQFVTYTLDVVGVKNLKHVDDNEQNWLVLAYWTGVIISTIVLLVKIAGIKKQLKLPANGSAFSFWKTKVIDPKLASFTEIEAHENIHIKQLHSIDVLFVEILRVFFWFNPILYAYRKSLKYLHEYLADEYASAFALSKKNYAMLLFLQNQNAVPVLANTFSSAPMLQSRIEMLQRKKSNRYKSCKYILAIPVIFFLSSLTSFSNEVDDVDTVASFPGGFEAFSNYLIKNLKKVSTKKGRVMVSFIVEKDGTITNGKIENGLNKACDKEALRVISQSPKWNPALKSNQQVRSGYQIGINFSN